eukprot:3917-Eustigmatos_ZCMA.PRE.1
MAKYSPPAYTHSITDPAPEPLREDPTNAEGHVRNCRSIPMVQQAAHITFSRPYWDAFVQSAGRLTYEVKLALRMAIA